jgi:benzil reductase ((S)-benzoin forming)
MSSHPKQHHVIVTGTSRGLGKEIAVQLLQSGYSVTGCSRSAVPGELQNSERYRHLSIDLGDAAAADLLMSQVTEGKASCIILNAAEYKSFQPDDYFTFERQLKLNFVFPAQMLHRISSAKLPVLLRVINISSIMAFIPDEINPLYSAAKAGVAQYVSSLQWKNDGQHSYMNVFVGPLSDIQGEKGALKKLAGTTYHDAAKQVVKHVSTKTSSLYIPAIWKFAPGKLPAQAKEWIRRNRRPEQA